MPGYSNIAKAHLDKETKTLVIEEPKKSFMPSYVYYLVTYYRDKLKADIQYVMFLYDSGNKYEVDKMKGIYDWSDLK